MKTKYTGGLALVALLAISPLSGFAQMPGAPPNDAPAVAANMSPGASEVVRLAQSGVSDDVVMAYIQNSQATFSLSSDAVVYLKDLGLSSPVVTAMLNHDTSLSGRPYNYDQKLYPPANQPANPPTVPQPVEPVQTQDQYQPPVAPPTDPSLPPPSYDSNPPQEVNYFYNDLSPYGAWVNLPGYGWCWQPSTVVINHSWQPYCDGGHWVYSDAGWFWQSDYSWGWAPFHYGRWHRDERCGWVWFPDTTWGPAWVVWRGGGDNCGWAPLPLHATIDVGGGFRFNGVHVGADFDFGLGVNLFTFVGLGDFRDHDLRRRRMQPVEVNRIYNRTTVINNYVVENKVIINRGIDVKRVAAATHTEIKTVNVRQLPAGEHSPRGNGATPAVYRHELKAPDRTEHVVAQRLDERHPVIQHAAITPTVPDRRPGNPGRTTQPAPQIQQQQRGNPNNQPRQPGNERIAPQNQNQNQPQPQNERRGAPPATAVTPTRPESPGQPTAPRPAEPRTQAPVLASKPAAPERIYTPPAQIPRQPASLQTRPEAPTQDIHNYQPKSARQAAEAHALPPLPQQPVYHITQPAAQPRQTAPPQVHQSPPVETHQAPPADHGNNGNNGNGNGNGRGGDNNGNNGNQNRRGGN